MTLRDDFMLDDVGPKKPKELKQVIYYNRAEGLDVPEVHDYFSPIKNLDQLKALKAGESLWERDSELSPDGGVSGFTLLQLKKVTPHGKSIRIAYGGLFTGEQNVTNQNLGNLFTLKNPEGLTALINKYGDRLTTVEMFVPSGLSRGNYKVTSGYSALRELRCFRL